MARKAMAILADITEARKNLESAEGTEKKNLEAQLAKLQTELETAVKEGGKKEAFPPKKDDKDDDEEMDEAMGKLVPRGAEESEEAYKTRMSKIKAAMKGRESVQMTAEELRIKNPKLFEAVAARVRKHQESQSEDLAEVKTENKKLVTQLTEARVELEILKDRREAETLLTEAAVPTKFLKVEHLLGKTTEEKKAEIERVQALIEAAGGGRSFHLPSGARGGGQAGGGLKEAVANMKKKAGVSADDAE